jgi:hypothetical protein
MNGRATDQKLVLRDALKFERNMLCISAAFCCANNQKYEKRRKPL